VVVREWQIYKVPIFVSCEVIVADVLTSGWIVGWPIFAVYQACGPAEHYDRMETLLKSIT